MIEWERIETELFHLYGNPPGKHGRLITTTDSDLTAKQYLLDLYGVPLDSWQVRHTSGDGSHVTVWISQFSNAQIKQGETQGTYFTAERVRVVQALKRLQFQP